MEKESSSWHRGTSLINMLYCLQRKRGCTSAVVCEHACVKRAFRLFFFLSFRDSCLLVVQLSNGDLIPPLASPRYVIYHNLHQVFRSCQLSMCFFYFVNNQFDLSGEKKKNQPSCIVGSVTQRTIYSFYLLWFFPPSFLTGSKIRLSCLWPSSGDTRLVCALFFPFKIYILNAHTHIHRVHHLKLHGQSRATWKLGQLFETPILTRASKTATTQMLTWHISTFVKRSLPAPAIWRLFGNIICEKHERRGCSTVFSWL